VVNILARPYEADFPDVRVRFVDRIDTCGYNIAPYFLGCAPYPDSIETYETADVRIAFGNENGQYTNRTIQRTLKHEFGHLHGVEHDQEPQPLMNETGIEVLRPQPNATEQAIPWENDTIQIYIDEESFADSINDDIDDQVSNTLAWFNNGKGKTPDNLTVERTQNRSEAEIVVTSGNVREGYASTTENFYGRDVDEDGSYEYYTYFEIIIDPEVESDRFGWNVGYWIDTVVNPDENSEPFEDPDGGDRRDWWEDY
jgi:hypothetical protein